MCSPWERLNGGWPRKQRTERKAGEKENRCLRRLKWNGANERGKFRGKLMSRSFGFSKKIRVDGNSVQMLSFIRALYALKAQFWQ